MVTPDRAGAGGKRTHKHRFTESIRLEKTSEIIQSNIGPPDTWAMAVGAVSGHVLNSSSYGHSAMSLGNLFQCLTVVPAEESFTMSSLSLPWLEATSSCAVVHKNLDSLPGAQQASH